MATFFNWRLYSIKKYEIVKFIDNQFELDVYVNPNEETIWLTQNEIAELLIKIEKLLQDTYRI